MAMETDNSRAGTREKDAEAGRSPDLEKRYHAAMEWFKDRYIRTTYHELGAASTEETQQLLEYLERADASNEESVRDLERIQQTYYRPMLESAHKLYHQELMDELLRAYNTTPRAISMQNIREWSDRFKNPNAHYKDRESFIRHKLPGYIVRWKEVAQKRSELLRDPRVKELSKEDMKEEDLQMFLDEESFLSAHYDKRVDLVNNVIAALTAQNKGGSIHALYKLANATLDDAVKIGALASSKKGTWLRRIFESGTNPKNIRTFLEAPAGKKGSLAFLIGEWKTMSDRFHKIEDDREEKGTPMSFHFVHIDVFLGWHFEKRKAYVQEAEKRFTDIDKEPQEFLRIRHALDAKDWADADTLIAGARVKQWSPEQQEKLRSMEKFLREHRSDQQRSTEKQNPSPEEIIGKLRDMVSKLPPSLQRLYSETMQRGYGAFWTLTTLMYNRCWCWRHRHLDDDKESRLRENAKFETYQHLEFGHGTGYENNDMTKDTATRPAIRTRRDVCAPQIIHADDSSAEQLAKIADENQKNQRFWYWGTLIPKNVTYGEHEYIVDEVQPEMKRLMRMLQATGVPYTPSGEIENYSLAA